MRNLLLAAVFLVASVPAEAAVPRSILGTWYFNGDPSAPCRIDYQRNRQAPLLFTNEKGGTSGGRMIRGGVFAYGWGAAGTGLSAHFTPEGDLLWDNNSVWTRYPNAPPNP